MAKKRMGAMAKKRMGIVVDKYLLAVPMKKTIEACYHLTKGNATLMSQCKDGVLRVVSAVKEKNLTSREARIHGEFIAASCETLMCERAARLVSEDIEMVLKQEEDFLRKNPGATRR